MNFVKKHRTNISIISVIAAAISVWQFYVFVTFTDAKGAVDMQGGISHLWWAIAVGLIACVGGFFVFSVFLRHDSADELHITS